MIPLPPPDPALPALAAALDGEAMRAALDRALSGDAAGVAACRPRYVRYKPGTNCLVLYDLTLRDRDGGTVAALPAHVRFFGDGGAAAAQAGQPLARLVERAARHHPDLPLRRAAHLPDLRAVAQLYPVDTGLRTLVHAAAVGKIRRAFRQALPAGTPKPRDVELVRYKPGRKALLRYRPRRAPDYYGKVYADDRGAARGAVTRALAAAGVPVPTPLTYLPELRLLLAPAAAGRPLAALPDAVFDTWLAPVAEALARLHAIAPAGLPLAPRDEAAALRAAGQAVGALLPPLAGRAACLAARLADELSRLGGPAAVVHGDFYADQALVSDAGVTLLDFDEAGLGQPALDAGNFLAHLTAAREPDAAAVEAARDAFTGAYLAASPTLGTDGRRAVALGEAVGLLKLAVGPFRQLRPDWPARIERLVELAEERLRDYRRRPVAIPTPPRDPALPQLASLLDPALLADELSRAVYREPVAVERIAVARHKPGRRCILRYDLRIGPAAAPRRERLYGKTFASERGPRVHAIVAAIAAARACGPDVRLPAPVGYLPHLKLLLQRAVPGEPAGPALLRGDTALAARVADALHALHASGLDLGRRHDLDKELAPLRERVARLDAACPSLAAPAARCLALVEAGRQSVTAWRWRPIHRDFYHDQLLVGPEGLAVLDFDDAALSEPAIDVANFVAHLALLALQHRADAEASARVTAAFLARYRGHDPDLDPALLRFLEGATLLRLAEIHLPRERGAWLAARLLDRSERLLADA